jgi:hypothetical protein
MQARRRWPNLDVHYVKQQSSSVSGHGEGSRRTHARRFVVAETHAAAAARATAHVR